MDLKELLKEAYASGVAEAQAAEQMPNTSFDFDSMSRAYAQSKVENLCLFSISQKRKVIISFLKKVKGVKIPDYDSNIEMMVTKYI
jgi:hypothetical protein